MHDIADLMDKNGVVFNPLIFRLATKLVASDNLKEGEYDFTPEENLADVIIEMREGHSVVRFVPR